VIDEFAVKFATEYLDKQFAKGESVDLVGMPNHVDYFERVTQAVAGGKFAGFVGWNLLAQDMLQCEVTDQHCMTISVDAAQ
jgi:hypothetical protein